MRLELHMMLHSLREEVHPDIDGIWDKGDYAVVLLPDDVYRDQKFRTRFREFKESRGLPTGRVIRYGQKRLHKRDLTAYNYVT